MASSHEHSNQINFFHCSNASYTTAIHNQLHTAFTCKQNPFLPWNTDPHIKMTWILYCVPDNKNCPAYITGPAEGLYDWSSITFANIILNYLWEAD